MRALAPKKKKYLLLPRRTVENKTIIISSRPVCEPRFEPPTSKIWSRCATYPPVIFDKKEVLGRSSSLLSFHTQRIAYKTTPPTILCCCWNVLPKPLPGNGIQRQTNRPSLHTTQAAWKMTRSTILLLLRVLVAAETCLSSRCLANCRGLRLQTQRVMGRTYEVRRWDGLGCHDVLVPAFRS
jgi:hypothetical protein